MSDLTLRDIYPVPPGDELAAAFLRHVGQTGQPETFATISTTQPPKDGTVVVLEHPVDINRKTRSDRGRAPCPICSPTSGKYLHRGSLIWCEATQAIYAIGPDCSDNLWADGRMNRAINVFMEGKRAKADGIALYHLIRRIPRFRSWIEDNRALADQVTKAHSTFASDMRRLRPVLSRALKASDGWAKDRGPLADIPIGMVSGRAFLSGSWSLPADLSKASTTLSEYPQLNREDLLGWIDRLAPSARAAKRREVEGVLSALDRVAERIVQAGYFLGAHNVEVLGRWGRSEGAPIAFSVSTTATRITFRCGDAVWQGPALLPQCKGSLHGDQGWSLMDAA